MKDAKIIKNCLLCGAITKEMMDFGSSPLANEFLEEKAPQDRFPLVLHQCIECQHVQLNCIVNPERLFKHYLYVAGTSQTNVLHFKRYAEKMIQEHHLTYEDLVMDVGSNDGTFLKVFQDKGIRILGVDPAANIVKEANENDIETVEGFFTPELAKRLVKKYGKASLITGNNFFAHAENLHEIIEAVKIMLMKHGAFVFEVTDLVATLKNKIFDIIYSEHIHFHSIGPLMRLFDLHGMKVFDIEKIPNHGGSLRVSVSFKENGRTPYIMQPEDIVSDEMIEIFKNGVGELKTSITSMLRELRAAGKTVSIFGFPAKATTLCSYFEIDALWISSIYDDAVLKQGRWIPGASHIVKDPKELYIEKPDYLLVLGWNFFPGIKDMHPNFKGRWIVPFPTLQII